MYKQIWHLFVAIGGGIVILKPSIVKYVLYKPEKMISTYGVHIIFQYFVIYFD